MDEYLSNDFGGAILSEGDALGTMPENNEVGFLNQNSIGTVSHDVKEIRQSIQDDAQYLSPQIIKFKKYTLKKG